MTLTVRLKPEIESALERHCAERGVTKSLVVQEVLAEYLARPAAKAGRRSAPQSAMPAEPSAAYRAFEAAGFIGAGDLGGVSADKAEVRAAFRRRLEEKRAAREAAASMVQRPASPKRRGAR